MTRFIFETNLLKEKIVRLLIRINAANKWFIVMTADMSV